MDLHGHAHELRAMADECRHEAALLQRRAHAVTWDGRAGSAFRAAAHAHAAALRATAEELDGAAAALVAHALACAPESGAAGVVEAVIGLVT